MRIVSGEQIVVEKLFWLVVTYQRNIKHILYFFVHLISTVPSGTNSKSTLYSLKSANKSKIPPMDIATIITGGPPIVVVLAATVVAPNDKPPVNGVAAPIQRRQIRRLQLFCLI